MKNWMVTILSGVLICTGCSADKTESNRLSSTSSKEQIQTSSLDEEMNGASVVYFSATGNTEKIAEKMAEITNADLYEIQPAEAYTDEDLNYNDNSCRANQEMNDENARPEIQNDLSVIENYETVYLGYPVWWGTAPRIIDTFLETYDLSDKNVYVFCTSGGSGIENSMSDLADKADIIDGHRFDAEATDKEIEEWLESLR